MRIWERKKNGSKQNSNFYNLKLSLFLKGKYAFRKLASGFLHTYACSISSCVKFHQSIMLSSLTFLCSWTWILLPRTYFCCVYKFSSSLKAHFTCHLFMECSHHLHSILTKTVVLTVFLSVCESLRSFFCLSNYEGIHFSRHYNIHFIDLHF